MNEPVRSPAQQPWQQIGIDADGRPIYLQPQAPAPAPQGPLKAYPVGTWVAFGCLGLVALVVVLVLVLAVVFGFAILAAFLALLAVVITICVLVLRDVWRQSRKD